MREDGGKVPLRTESGEQQAWESLGRLRPEDVCREAGAGWDPVRGVIRVGCFGARIEVRLREREVASPSPGGRVLLGELRDLFVPALLCHLATAKELPETGKLVRPEDLSGGQLFAAGSHVLPLDGVARRFARDAEGFLRAGAAWGGVRAPHGDAALRFLPFPRVPTMLILWLEDEEFPARASLLLDSSCEHQAAADVRWAVTTATVLLMGRTP